MRQSILSILSGFVTRGKSGGVVFFCLTVLLNAGSAHSVEPAKETAAEKLDLPPPEKIAAELGYKPKEFKKAVDDFALAISQGSKSQALRRLCVRDEETCNLIKDFQKQNADASRERNRRRHRVKRFRITEDNIAQAQRFDFRILVNSLKLESESRLYSLAEKSLQEEECPRNLSAALAVSAEEYFPAEKAREVARDLFDHGRKCLASDDPVYERLHLRYALFALYDGNKQKARELLVSAKEAKSHSERYRVLYWLGQIAHESGVKFKDNKDWIELMNEYPLSFYAIQAAVAAGQDPMQVITHRKVGGLQREVKDDPELDKMIRWLEALYVQKKNSAVAKWASWIVRVNEGAMDVDVLHYISTMKIAAGMYRSNISMLFSYFKNNPSALNEEGLRLLYPRPYFNLIQDASKGKIDTYLVLALVRQESAFDPRAVSRAKAKGLMQIIPQTARRLASQGHKKLMNEKANTQMGVKYLVQLSEKFDGAIELVLAGYNAGPHRVEEWMKRYPERNKNPLLWNDLIPYMETRDYVVSILRNNYLYARLYGQGDKDQEDKIITSILVNELLKDTPDRKPAEKAE